jgi:hypothetical protein
VAEPRFYDPTRWAFDPRLAWLARTRLYGARPWSGDDLANWSIRFYGTVTANISTGIPTFTPPVDCLPQVPGGGPPL